MTDNLEEFFGKSEVSDAPMYIKFPEGRTKLRVLSKELILGYKGWYKDMPVTLRATEGLTQKEQVLLDKNTREDGTTYAKYNQFGACLVWNYDLQAVQIWEFTQATIKTQILALISNPDWGNLAAFDITIERTGKGLKTRYSLTPSPGKPLSAEAKEAFEKTRLDPKAAFTDEKNVERIKELKEAAGSAVEDGINPDDIPF
jgi:hypothetical protein